MSQSVHLTNPPTFSCVQWLDCQECWQNLKHPRYTPTEIKAYLEYSVPMNKTRGFSKHGIWPFNRMAFSDVDYSPSCRTNQNNNTQEPAAHTPYSCEEFLRASLSSSVTPNAPRRCSYCTWTHIPREYKAKNQSFRERNKRQELERSKSRIYTSTLENTRNFYLKKTDKKMANHKNDT